MGDLDPTQQLAIDAVVSGVNVFITGPAGVGKSFLLKKIKELYPDTDFVAYTGIAAVNISGLTINSWAGLGIDERAGTAIAKDMRRDLKKHGKDHDCGATRIINCNRLVIDEISMLSHDMFDRLDTIARILRKEDSPFGGIQLIVVGDFYQLPPISGDYCFEDSFDGTNLWRDCDFTYIKLEKVYRQSDPVFVELLHRMRVNKNTEADFKLLDAAKDNVLDCSDGIKPTRVYCVNKTVDKMNDMEYMKLDNTGLEMTYQAVTRFEKKKKDAKVRKEAQYFEKNCPARLELSLRIGAQVMLVSNIDVKSGLCNGSRGVVIGFGYEDDTILGPVPSDGKFKMPADKTRVFPIVNFIRADGSYTARLITPNTWTKELKDITEFRKQIPLRLAWAITVHRSQGQTLTKCEIDVGQAFAAGQTYVGISRAASLERARLVRYDKRRIQVSRKVVKFYDGLDKKRKAE
jgi:ATP-dependent DNA helicase PIF1